MREKLKKLFLDLLFPKFCFGCRKEGTYLCEDCRGILGIEGFHKDLKTKHLDNLYFPLSYKNNLVKNIILKFKYEPFLKDLSSVLSSLIISNIKLLEKKPDFSKFIVIPMPLSNKRLKWRGFNQAEEIAKKLSFYFQIPLIKIVLIKNKETPPQTSLNENARKMSVLNAFSCKNEKKIFKRKILLVDDVYTTGSTMEEAARVLKESGAKKVIGIVIARAEAGTDIIK